MFGFGNRKKYNGAVDLKVRNGYGIVTSDNPKFGGPLSYLSLIDKAWEADMSIEEAGMYIAALYYAGIIKQDRNSPEVKELSLKIRSTSLHDHNRGLIGKARYAGFIGAVEKAEFVS